MLNRTEPAIAPHEGGNLELIAAVAGQRPLGVVEHLSPAARDDDDLVADAVQAAIGEAGLEQLLG